MKYLLDTNVLREIGKSPSHARVRAWHKSVDDSELAISVLTVREVQKGIARLKSTKPDVSVAIEARMESIYRRFGDRILPIDKPIAERWGDMLAARDKHTDDTGLAATASVRNLVLVTRNIRDVAGRGVPLVDPFRAIPS